jgi:hypothetical protein
VKKLEGTDLENAQESSRIQAVIDVFDSINFSKSSAFMSTSFLVHDAK